MSETSDDELHQLRRMRPANAAAVRWEQPPAAVWKRIAEETAIAPRRTVLAEHRRRRPLPLLGAAAAAVVVVAVIAAAVLLGDNGSGDTVLASTRLDTLAGGGSGSVELVNHRGHMQLHLHTADLGAYGGYIEVWMIDPTVTRMISLGPLRADGSYDLPDTMDPSDFPIVDISAEPNDGNPAHSGTSLLRGQLDIST